MLNHDIKGITFLDQSLSLFFSNSVKDHLKNRIEDFGKFPETIVLSYVIR